MVTKSMLNLPFSHWSFNGVTLLQSASVTVIRLKYKRVIMEGHVGRCFVVVCASQLRYVCGKARLTAF